MGNTEKTKREFEKALFNLLEKKNYHDITINEICALANKTKMTFYHYYNNKKHGELDFLVDYQGDVLPLEIKSGKDYRSHSALS